MAGTLTLEEMRTEVLDNLTQEGVSTTANGVTLSTMADRWLNRAQSRIARMYDLIWREQTAQTVASQKTYSFDSSIRAIKSLRIEDGLDSKKLILIMPTAFDKLFPKPDEQSENLPVSYIPFENTKTFELFPIPDAIYTMRIRASFYPTLLTSDSQTSDYNYLDDVIISYATMYGYQWLQEMNDSKFWKAIGNDELKAQLNAEMSKFPDWVMVREGFGAGDGSMAFGEYYNNPFVLQSPGEYVV